MNKRILILTLGSRGDVQPYIALGKELKQAGFEVTLALVVQCVPNRFSTTSAH
ncbi:MAG: glycosyltransferase [Oculatellaceae cyanobacterium Prado106]|jgi:UDP:flavonoid glycosyltransferase YjiC (YdhE family)|nr:glycosyltransferase [Oculatellaceae cyanobacterium Prado106]